MQLGDMIWRLLGLVFFMGSACPDLEAQQVVSIHAQPGKTISLEANYKDKILVVRGRGSAAAPAIVDGKGVTVLTGNSQLYITGEYIMVQNVKVVNPDLIKGIRSVVSLRYKKETGNNCTIKNIQFIQEPGRKPQQSYSWLEVFGQNNTVRGCLFKGKTNRNPILHVDVDNDQPDNNIIENNTFTDIPVRREEAMEAIRIGLGKGVSGTRVKDNIFRKCFGDSETISSKSSGNKITGNYFIECRSGISLRVGNNALIAGNVFYGTRNGVRVVGKGHKIENNCFFNVPVSTSNGGGLILMVGAPSPAADCHYEAVSNVVVESNIFSNNVGLRVLKPSDKCNNYPRNIVFKKNKLMEANIVYALRDTSVTDFRSGIEPVLKRISSQALARSAASAGGRRVVKKEGPLSVEAYKNGAYIFNNYDFGPGFFTPKQEGKVNEKSNDASQRYNEALRRIKSIRAGEGSR